MHVLKVTIQHAAKSFKKKKSKQMNIHIRAEIKLKLWNASVGFIHFQTQGGINSDCCELSKWIYTVALWLGKQSLI